MCVISDKSGVLGLGGIIGGTRSGTEFNTKNILLESAYFYPSSVRKTSKILSLDTDAKFRFERGIDPNSILEGLEVASKLIVKICGGTINKFQVVGKKEHKLKQVEFDLNKFKKIIGFPVSPPEIKKILNSLGFKINASKNKFKVIIPSWRPDITQDIDLVEEIVRIKGFDKIGMIEPKKTRDIETLNFQQKLFHLSQRAVANKGFLETVTWSFTDEQIDNLLSNVKDPLYIQNPISSDLNVLRRSIFSNLLFYLKKNQDRGFKDISLFEIGPIFFGKNLASKRWFWAE